MVRLRLLPKYPISTSILLALKAFYVRAEQPDQESLKAASAAMQKAVQMMNDPNIDILILDEINNAIYFDLVSEEEVLSLLDQKRPDQELILTGRSATAVIIARADLVTEMKEIKHPYQKGISARRGIEY